MRIRQLAKKAFLIAKWLVLIPIVLLLLVIGLLQLPAVQNQLTGTLEKQLSKRLRTEVQIGRIGLDFPKYITIEKVYLKTPAGDSLFSLGKLGVDLDMWGLLQQQVVIQKVSVERLFARVAVTDSTSNIQFLLDAFSSNSQPAKSSPDLGNPGWEVKFLKPSLLLRKIDLYYQDDPNGILLDITLNTFSGAAERIDLKRQQYIIGEATLGGGTIKMDLADRPEQPDTTSEVSEASNMKITCRELRVEQIRFDLETSTLTLQTSLPEGKLDAATVELNEALSFQADRLSLSQAAYSMTLGQTRSNPGFDPAHLQLREINILAADLQYHPDSILADIRNAAAQTSDGPALETLSGKIKYYPQGLQLSDLNARTQRSAVSIPELRLGYPFTATNARDTTLSVAGAIQVQLAIADLLYFVPQLDSIEILAANRNRSLTLNTNLSSEQSAVFLDQLQLRGPGLRWNGDAQIINVLQPDRLLANLRFRELGIAPDQVRPLLPDSLFPSYIIWPRSLQIKGTVNYQRDSINLALRVQEERDSSDLPSLLVLRGSVSDFTAFPASTLDLTLDTIRFTRQSARAYLPPGSMPADYRLPDYVEAAAHAKGSIGNLAIELQLATATGGARLQTGGTIRNLPQTDSLWVDLAVPLLALDQQELVAVLPDSTLPADLRLPDLQIRAGKVSGSLRDLDLELPFYTNNGNGRLSGHYGGTNYRLEGKLSNFRPERLFRGARGDSIARLALEPLQLDLQSSGELSPTLNARLRLSLSEGNKGALVELVGSGRRDTLAGTMTFAHNDLQGTATATYIRRDSLPQLDAGLSIRRADLQRWRLSDRPLFLSGSGQFKADGLQLDDLSARLRLQDILLRSDTSTAFVDSLFAYAELHRGRNEVEVFSDLLSFSLEGSFRPTLVFQEISRFLQAYWQEDIEQPDPVVYGNYLRAYLELHNPKPLTSGIIPGLRELSPMTATFLYRERQPELSFVTRIPRLDYAGVTMDSLQIDAKGSRKELNYRADWQNINLLDQVLLGQTRIYGGNTGQALTANFQIFDKNGESRHHLKLNIDPEVDSLRIRLAPEQKIDYLTWRIPADNLLQIADQRIMVQNWELQLDDQSLRLFSPGVHTLQAELKNISLAPFSRLIRPNEEFVVGVIDGVIKVNNPFSDLKFNAGIDIRDLSVYQRLWGNLSIDLANQQADLYRLDLQLSEAENEVNIAGTFVPGAELDLQIDLSSLKLETVEPLSLGYLSNAQGRLTGSLAISGNFDRPVYRGQLQFEEAAVDVPLLKTRFQIENEPIRFNGRTVAISKLRLIDPQRNEATLRGNINALSLSNFGFDLTATARDFLVLNTTREDNNLYYGYLRADADVQISGDLYEPVLEVTASPSSNSRLTYLLDQSAVPQAESRVGVVRFVEQYEWRQTILADSIQQMNAGGSRGFDLTTNLNVNPGLEFTVVIDPVTGDQFTGRGEGDIVFRQYADGRMEMTGRIEMVEGQYDFTYQGLINRKFTVEPGSSISWQGDPMNPSLDLSISSYVQTSPYPLVSEFAGATEANLRRKQTFAVRLYLKGTLESMQVSTDVVYPEDLSGNSGLPAIEQSLSMLRNNPSQLNTQAFGLLLFRGFVNFGDAAAAPGDPLDNSVQSGLDNVLSQQLNNLANRYINFVELDFGMESFNTDQGGRQRDLRLSLRKRLFNDRLIISIDGVTQTGEIDERNSLPQTYLDNLTAEFLLSKNGGLRLKVFSNRELDQFTTGDVVRVGGHLAFSKDFNRFFWSSDRRPARDVPDGPPAPEDAAREEEQKIELEQE